MLQDLRLTSAPARRMVREVGQSVEGSLQCKAQFSGGGLGYGSCIAQAGLEVSRYGSGVQSGYVSYTMNHDTYWYDQNRQGKGGWAQGTERRYQQYPCYLGQVPPNCLNGQWNSGVQWSANKP